MAHPQQEVVRVERWDPLRYVCIIRQNLIVNLLSKDSIVEITSAALPSLNLKPMSDHRVT